jgi:hypothetical protein
MSGRSPDDSKHLLAAFHQGLQFTLVVHGSRLAAS